MTLTKTNLFSKVSRIYKGYLTLYDSTAAADTDLDEDGVVFDRIAELQHGVEQTNAATYGTFGDKKLATVGYDGDCSVRVAETADLYPTTNADTTPKFNVSYFLNKLTNLELIPARFSGVAETDGTGTEKYIVTVYRGFVIGTRVERNNTLGIYERVFDFDIITVETSIRRTAQPETIT